MHRKEKPIVLLIGGTGYIGRHLALLLDATIYVATREYAPDQVCYSSEGIVHTPPEIDRIDIVCFLAGIGNIHVCEEAPEQAYAINAQMNKRICEDLAQQFTFHSIVFSSDAVYSGQVGEIYSEDSLTEPQSVYGKTKLALEGLFQKQENSTIVRISKVWGMRGCPFVKIVSLRDLFFIEDQYLRPIYIGDVVRCVEYIILNNIRGLICLTGPEVLSWKEIGVRFGISNPQTKRFASFKDASVRPQYLDVRSNKDWVRQLVSTKVLCAARENGERSVNMEASSTIFR